MFKLSQTHEFTHTVHVQTPVDGGHKEETLKARFRRLPADEAEAHDTRTGDGMVAFLKAAIVSLSDLVDENDTEIAYCDAVRDAVLKDYAARVALFNTYIAAVTKAKRGN